MPYRSDRQRRYFHTATARRAGITPAMVDEYDKASKGHKLPEVIRHPDAAAHAKHIRRAFHKKGKYED